MPNSPFKIAILITLTLAGHVSVAAAGNETAELVQELVHERGYDRGRLEALLAEARRSQQVIDSLNRPAEKIYSWKSYRPIFLKPNRIEAGVAYWKKHEATLARAAEQYGVDPEIIVAIIGIETFYGQRPGNIRVLDALYTQAYHYPKRYQFGRNQLKAFLQILMEEHIEPAMAMGSYAGAMGTPQFIPTSYLSFAVDFNADGKRDIWTSDDDVIGSVANYFSKHAWRKGEPVAQPIQRINPDDPLYVEPAQPAAKPDIPLQQLAAAGINLPKTGNRDALGKIIHLQGDDGDEFWVGLHNFYVITRYNHSNLYAMAAYQLSQEILALKNGSSTQ